MKLVLKLTDACNLACSYCYAKSRRVMAHEKPGLRGRFEALLDTAPTLERDVIFFGGEPLIKVNLIKSLVRGHPECRFSVNTNGMLVNKATARFFAAYDVSVSLALDGGPRSHDLHRKTRGGKPTHAKVMRAFDTLVKAGVPVAVRMTVTPQTAGALAANVHWLAREGVTHLGMAPAVQLRWSREAVELFGDQMQRLASEYSTGRVPRIFDFERVREGRAAGCRPGVDTVTVDRSGRVFPCHRSRLAGAGASIREGRACASCAARPYCTMCIPKLGLARPGPRCTLKLALVPAYAMIRAGNKARRGSMEKYTVIQGKVYQIPADVLKKYQLSGEEAHKLQAAGKGHAPKSSKAEPPLKGNWYELGESDCF